MRKYNISDVIEFLNKELESERAYQEYGGTAFLTSETFTNFADEKGRIAVDLEDLKEQLINIVTEFSYIGGRDMYLESREDGFIIYTDGFSPNYDQEVKFDGRKFIAHKITKWTKAEY